MKKILLLSFLFLLNSCPFKTFSSSSIIELTHNYEEIEDKMIQYEDILQKEGAYFVYIFSKTCHNCFMLKNDIIKVALERNDFYFIEYDTRIPVNTKSIDVKSFSSFNDIYIYGTPSLFIIENHIVSSLLSGFQEIRNYLDYSFL